VSKLFATGPQADRIGVGILCGLTTFFIFSSIDAIVKWIGGTYSVFMITFMMSAFAMLPTGALIARSGGVASLRPRSPWLVTIRALLMTVATLSTYTAFKTLSIAETYTLIFTSPLIVTAFSVPLLGEKVGWRRWVAVAVGFVGVLVMLRPGLRPLGFGHLAAFTTALTFGLGALILRKGGNESSSAMLTPMVVIKGLICGVLLLAIEDAWRTPTWPDLGLMALAGLLYGVAHTFFIFAFKYAPASVIAPFQYTQMIGAVFYGFVLFGSVPDGYLLAGAAIVMGSGIYIAMREKTLHAKPSADSEIHQ